MKKYKYIAKNLEQKVFKGVFLAEDEQELARRLAEQKLYLVSAKPMTQTTASSFFSVTGKVTTNELASFCRQFAIMLTTGISIIQSIEILQGQSYSDLLRKTIEFLHEDVKSGSLLSQAMEKHKKIFPPFLCSMIYVGELSGALDKIFVTLADYLESEARIKKQTKSALTYPLVLIVMAIGICVLMVAFIIPTFMEALASMDVEMPKITLILNNISIWFKANWKQLTLAIVALVMVFILIIRTPKGKYYWDAFRFKGPLISKINVALVTARFARAFGLLVDGGADTVDALETSKVVVANKYVESKMNNMVEDVRQGMSLTMALSYYKVFPPLIIQMISVGEQTGNLAEVLIRSCPFFDNEAERIITSMTALLQPLILGIIGLLVGTLFYAVYSPLLQIMNTIGV